MVIKMYSATLDRCATFPYKTGDNREARKLVSDYVNIFEYLVTP